MREADLADEFELGVFGQRWDGFGDFEHCRDDVVGGVAKVPTATLAPTAINAGRTSYQSSLSESNASSIFCS